MFGVSNNGFPLPINDNTLSDGRPRKPWPVSPFQCDKLPTAQKRIILHCYLCDATSRSLVQKRFFGPARRFRDPAKSYV